jgi:Uma2 family endonuclease
MARELGTALSSKASHDAATAMGYREQQAMGFAMNEQSKPQLRPATYQDILDAPPHMVAEIVHGALHLHPRPHPRHARAVGSLGHEVVGPFDKGRGGPGGWWILIEPELHLGQDVLVPDLAGWRRERLPTLTGDVHIEVPPDWVCEVISSQTRTFDLTEKRDVYAEHGIGHLWLVDPIARTLEVFHLVSGAWTLNAALHDDAEVRLPPFEAVAFALSDLWAD